MKVVFKYVIGVTDEIILVMPRDAVVIAVKEQHGQICLWALQDRSPGADSSVLRRFAVFGTGRDIPDYSDITHLDTVRLMNGSLVVHVFEVMP